MIEPWESEASSSILDAEGTARLRVKLGTTSGRVTEVLIQLEIRLEGAWHPVVRYDTAHGFPHRDRLDRAGTLTKSAIDLPDLAAFMAFSEQDLCGPVGVVPRPVPARRKGEASVMTKRERVDAEISVAFDLIRFLIEHPATLKQLPRGAEVEIISSDRPVPPRAGRSPVVTFVARRTFKRVA